MFRVGGFLIVILITLVFLNPQIFNNLKERSIEFVNPAVKEKRLLNDLSYQIEEFGNLANSEEFSALSEDEKINTISSFLGSHKSTLSEIEQLNEKRDLAATVSNLLQKILPGNKTQLDPQPTWLPAGAGCE